MVEISVIITEGGADYRFVGGPFTIDLWGGGRADPISAGYIVAV